MMTNEAARFCLSIVKIKTHDRLNERGSVLFIRLLINVMDNIAQIGFTPHNQK